MIGRVVPSRLDRVNQLGSTRMNLVDVDTDREDKQVGRQVNKARASGADADQRRGQKNTMLKKNKI